MLGMDLHVSVLRVGDTKLVEGRCVYHTTADGFGGVVLVFFFFVLWLVIVRLNFMFLRVLRVKKGFGI